MWSTCDSEHETKSWKDLLLVIVLHSEWRLILARSNQRQLRDWVGWFRVQTIKPAIWERVWKMKDMDLPWCFKEHTERWGWTKAFHHHHRTSLTVVKHTWKDHSLYTSFGCTVFDHEIHILWATSHLEGIKGFMNGTLRTKETRHAHQTPLKLHSEDI